MLKVHYVVFGKDFKADDIYWFTFHAQTSLINNSSFSWLKKQTDF